MNFTRILNTLQWFVEQLDAEDNICPCCNTSPHVDGCQLKDDIDYFRKFRPKTKDAMLEARAESAVAG